MNGSSRITRITGRAVAVRGDDIDTDRIIPARFLKAITFDGLEAHLFEDDRREAADRGATHPLDVAGHAGATILVVGSNFGCGSSREHAPQAIRRWGIGAVVGESFAEIFFRNSVALGLPCVAASRDAIAQLMALCQQTPSAEFIVDLETMQVTAGEASLPITMPDSARDAFLSGAWDATGSLLERYEEVLGAASRLPYLHGFS